MNDVQIEQELRKLPAPELPETWRGEILATARRGARAERPVRTVWPEVLVYLRGLCARNPITFGALATMWAMIFLLRMNTPVDPTERELMAHIDPTQPIYIVSMQDQIKLAELWQEPPDQPEQMP